MTSLQKLSLFHCTRCGEKLSLDSKTLPCLHSFCISCKEPLTPYQLSLSPYLAKRLGQQKEEKCDDFNCYLCADDGIESAATNHCLDCQKLFCYSCCQYHEKFLKEHKVKDLDVMKRVQVMKAVEVDFCGLHEKKLDSYCKPCNKFFCDTCYKKHCDDSPDCSSRPLSVKAGALKKKSRAQTLAKEMDNMAISLRKLIEKTKNSVMELSADCNSKCQSLWENYKEVTERVKQKTIVLCDEMRKMTTEMLGKWHNLIDENESILKRLEIWRLNLKDLINESPQDVDAVCGLQVLESKMLSQLAKPMKEEKCQLKFTSLDWWQQMLEFLKTRDIGSVSFEILNFQETQKLPGLENSKPIKEWNPTGSKLRISSILVCKEDGHIFLACLNNNSIMELSQEGGFLNECVLRDREGKLFCPWNLSWISPNNFVVLAWRGFQEDKKLFFLERKMDSPHLRIKNVINTKNRVYSLCQIEENIYICLEAFLVYSLTKEGQEIKRIKGGEVEGFYWPQIRADPLNGCFWLCKRFKNSVLFCYNQNGEKVRKINSRVGIEDFFFDEFGDLYFCTEKEIYSYTPFKILFKFEKRSEFPPRMFVSQKRIFVSLRIDAKDIVRIYKI